MQIELAQAIETFENDPIQKFYLAAMKRSSENHERWGQAMFNHLSEIRPDLAEKIQGTDKDPFYSLVVDSKFENFLSFLETELLKGE